MRATAEPGVTDTFWAVDDIRHCYNDGKNKHCLFVTSFTLILPTASIHTV